MNQPDTPQPFDLPVHEAGPVFLEPWHAEAFSLTVALNQQGAFSWSEWAELFAATLREIPAESGESVEAAYYRRWLLALESLGCPQGSRIGCRNGAAQRGVAPLLSAHPDTASRWS